MSDNQVPATPATPVAPTEQAPKTETPVVEAKVSETPTTEKAPVAKVEAKADAAADKTGAEKVATDQYEIKVDGKVLTLNKEEMIKYAQLGHAGQKRMAEAAERERKADERENAVKSNWEKLQQALKEAPESVLEDEHIGHNKYELAQKWLAEKATNDAKSPEQKKLEEALARSAALEKQLKEIEKQKEEALRAKEQEEEQREMEMSMKSLETEMISAFKKYQLPNSPAMVDRMVGIMEVAKKNDLPVSIDDVAKIVRDDIKKDIQELAGLLPDDEFEELLGDIGINKIKASTLKKMKSAPKVDPTQVGKVDKKEAAPKPKKSIEDFMSPDWAK